MKICMFTNTFWPHVGGVARSVQFFTEDLVQLGHQVLVVAPEYEMTGELPGTDQYEIFRVPAWQNFNGSDFSMSLPIPFILDEKLEEFKPDVIHSHHPYLLGDGALRVARKRNLPLIFTHHTLYEEYTHYTPAESDTMRRFVMNLSTEYANLCSKVIAPSQSIERILKERGVSVPIKVIPTGVDTRFFAGGVGDRFRRSQGLGKENLVIGHLGRLAPEKNLEYLSDAVALFMKSHPDARFLVVGEGPSSIDIRKIFKERQVLDQLIMPGKASGQDLADAYQAMDLFVFASKTETQGMVLVEAMAAGKPVIALNANGSREVVENDRNGQLLPENASPEEFSRALESYVTDSPKGDAWRRQALKTAEKYSRQVTVGELEKLYIIAVETMDRSKTEIETEFPELFSVLKRIKTEWEILSEKTSAVMRAISRPENDRDYVE